MKSMSIKEEVVGEVTRAMAEVMERLEERYVSADELSKTFCFFTRDWLKRFGHMLPRTRVTVRMADGSSRTTGYGYRLHAIERMVADGEFAELEYKEFLKTNK